MGLFSAFNGIISEHCTAISSSMSGVTHDEHIDNYSICAILMQYRLMEINKELLKHENSHKEHEDHVYISQNDGTSIIDEQNVTELIGWLGNMKIHMYGSIDIYIKGSRIVPLVIPTSIKNVGYRNDLITIAS